MDYGVNTSSATEEIGQAGRVHGVLLDLFERPCDCGELALLLSVELHGPYSVHHWLTAVYGVYRPFLFYVLTSNSSNHRFRSLGVCLLSLAFVDYASDYLLFLVQRISKIGGASWSL